MKNMCLGTGASVGGVSGGMRRGHKGSCPICGRKVGMHAGRAGRLYPHQPRDEHADPDCSVCGAKCMWSIDAWVCTYKPCGSEWYPDHGSQYAEPIGDSINELR